MKSQLTLVFCLGAWTLAGCPEENNSGDTDDAGSVVISGTALDLFGVTGPTPASAASLSAACTGGTPKLAINVYDFGQTINGINTPITSCETDEAGAFSCPAVDLSFSMYALYASTDDAPGAPDCVQPTTSILLLCPANTGCGAAPGMEDAKFESNEFTSPLFVVPKWVVNNFDGALQATDSARSQRMGSLSESGAVITLTLNSDLSPFLGALPSPPSYCRTRENIECRSFVPTPGAGDSPFSVDVSPKVKTNQFGMYITQAVQKNAMGEVVDTEPDFSNAPGVNYSAIDCSNAATKSCFGSIATVAGRATADRAGSFAVAIVTPSATEMYPSCSLFSGSDVDQAALSCD
jgi:hypothetical protein